MDIVGREHDGTETLFARAFGVSDAGSVISEEGSIWFADIPNLKEIVIRREPRDRHND